MKSRSSIRSVCRCGLDILMLLIFIMTIPGCYVFSSLQSARMLKKDTCEITPSYSAISFSDPGGYEDYLTTKDIGLQLGYGVNDMFNMRLRYEMLLDDDLSDIGYHFLSIEPKLSAAPDVIAFSLPICFYFGEGMDAGETFHLQPSLFATMPLSKYAEINLNGRTLIFFEEGSDLLLAANLGLGLSSDLSKYALRPEVGWLVNPGEEGNYFQFSIGLSFIMK